MARPLTRFIMLTFTLTSAFIGLYIEAQAQTIKPDTIHSLLADCQKTDPKTIPDALDHTHCRGYIAGIRDVLGLTGREIQGEKIGPEKVVGICGSPDLPIDAYVQIFVNWALAHPENWGKHPLYAIFAFTEKWHC
jgi:hypothetical protein